MNENANKFLWGIAGTIFKHFVIPILVGYAVYHIFFDLLHLSDNTSFRIAFFCTIGAFIYLVYKTFTHSISPFKKRHYNVTQTTFTGKKIRDTVYQLLTDDRKLKLNITNPYAGVLILGGAGAGKSFSVIEPLITQSIQQGMAGLVYDFKFPTLATVAAGTANPKNIPCYYINFDNLSISHRVNPIAPEIMTRSSFADQAARTIMQNLNPPTKGGNAFFTDSAIAYLSGIIWFLREEAPQLCTLPHAMELASRDITKVIDLLKKNGEVAQTIASLRSAVEANASNQFAGVVSSLQLSLSKLNIREIVWVLSGQDFTLDLNTPKDPKFLTIGNNPELSDTYGPILALISTVALRLMNQQGKVPSAAILDEAPTLYLPNFSQIPATARSNKLATIFSVQDFSQIGLLYGNEEREAILSNLANKFFGRVNHPDTAQYVARMWGRQLVVQDSFSYGENTSQPFDSNSGVNTSITERDRVQVQEVTQLKTGEFFGQLVESNVTFFRAKIKPKTVTRAPIAPFKEVTDEMLKANQQRIREEIDQLLNTPEGIKAKPISTPIPPESNRFEQF